MVRGAIEKILGFPFSDSSYAQACLTPKLGGLGLRKTVEHADFAYQASWYECGKIAHETWDPPPETPLIPLTQKQASFKFDEQMLAFLVSQAEPREAQRLRRCAQPHASGFLTAVPSDEEGKDTIMKARNFRVAVAYRLGLPLLDSEIPCPLCTQTINVYGDHATCCAKSGDLIGRHNSLRNLVDHIAEVGGLSPVLEKKFILGDTPGRRPGDVTIMNWADNKGLAIDVAVTSPLITSQVHFVSPCEEYAATRKHAKYDPSFEGQDYFFSAMVWETLGAINVEGEGLLRQLFRFAARSLGREYSSFCGRSWARFSCNLQTSVSQMILTRIDGQ